MLRIETVESHTFSILNQLMEMPELQDFGLVGGTAFGDIEFASQRAGTAFGVLLLLEFLEIMV